MATVATVVNRLSVCAHAVLDFVQIPNDVLLKIVHLLRPLEQAVDKTLLGCGAVRDHLREVRDLLVDRGNEEGTDQAEGVAVDLALRRVGDAHALVEGRRTVTHRGRMITDYFCIDAKIRAHR